jgi:hypothetical protein
MAVELPRTLRGALAGATAAGVWAAQQPLDKRAFGVANDDAELLGTAVARGRAVVPVGSLLHVLNGALFGAVYANVAPSIPLPPWARGPLAGLAEQLATWPLVSVVDHIHPARDRIPPISSSRAAFWQATWRRLLFGFVMGELERRLNAPEPEAPSLEDVFSSNGHGSLERATPAVS